MYATSGIGARALQYYTLLLKWVSPALRAKFTAGEPNPFSFTHLRQWRPELLSEKVGAADHLVRLCLLLCRCCCVSLAEGPQLEPMLKGECQARLCAQWHLGKRDVTNRGILHFVMECVWQVGCCLAVVWLLFGCKHGQNQSCRSQSF